MPILVTSSSLLARLCYLQLTFISYLSHSEESGAVYINYLLIGFNSHYEFSVLINTVWVPLLKRDQENLSRFNLSILTDRRSSLCEKLLNLVMLDSSHKLSQFLSKQNVNKYNLRRSRHFIHLRLTQIVLGTVSFRLWQIFNII